MMTLAQRLGNHLAILRKGAAPQHYRNALRRRLARKKARWSENGYTVFAPHPGLKASLYEHDDLALEAYLHGLDPAIVTTVVNYLKPGMTVVDVGANVGLYSLLFALLVGPQGRVYSFEPVPNLSTRIKENLKLNGFSNVEVIEAAVGARSDTIRLYLSRFCGDGWASIYEWTHAGGEYVDVNLISLDEWVRDMGIDHLDLLKIDVEGAELDVYSGAQEIFKRGCVKAVITEFNKDTQAGAKISASDLEQVLTQNDYQWYSLPWSPKQALPVDWENLARLCDLIAVSDRCAVQSVT